MSRIGRSSWLSAVAFMFALSVASCAAGSAEFEAAAAALDENSADIAAGVGSVAPDQEMRFLDQWRSHITDFSDITGGALAAADVTEALGHRAETLAGAIDSFSGALVD